MSTKSSISESPEESELSICTSLFLSSHQYQKMHLLCHNLLMHGRLASWLGSTYSLDLT